MLKLLDLFIRVFLTYYFAYCCAYFLVFFCIFSKMHIVHIHNVIFQILLIAILHKYVYFIFCIFLMK